LARLAETLLPLIDGDSARAVELATAAIAEFSGRFEGFWLSGMRRKIGLITEEEGDAVLIGELLETMHRCHADFTSTFRRLCTAAMCEGEDAGLESQWIERWRLRLAREPQAAAKRATSMRSVNPYVIPRNHRIEAAIVAAVDRGDYAPFEELARVLSRPYEELPSFAAYAEPPLPAERVMQTFCGT
jgi:uncharacterized protein YdiU (UPF0061 family)